MFNFVVAVCPLFIQLHLNSSRFLTFITSYRGWFYNYNYYSIREFPVVFVRFPVLKSIILCDIFVVHVVVQGCTYAVAYATKFLVMRLTFIVSRAAHDWLFILSSFVSEYTSTFDYYFMCFKSYLILLYIFLRSRIRRSYFLIQS